MARADRFHPNLGLPACRCVTRFHDSTFFYWSLEEVNKGSVFVRMWLFSPLIFESQQKILLQIKII